MERRHAAGKDGVAPDSFRVESPGDVFGCADLRDSLSAHAKLKIGSQVSL